MRSCRQEVSGIIKSKYVDDKKITDHYAIIPTGQAVAVYQVSQRWTESLRCDRQKIPKHLYAASCVLKDQIRDTDQRRSILCKL